MKKLVAVLTVAVGTVFACLYFQGSPSLGYNIAIPNCSAPCTELSRLVYECHHFNPPGNVNCNPNICFRSGVTYAFCNEGDPRETGECLVNRDRNAIAVQQWRHAVNAPLTCVDNGFVPVPGFPQGPCVFVSPVGKCFQNGCPGAVIITVPPRKGRIVCCAT